MIIAMMTPRIKFYAKQLHDAITGIGTNEDTIIEILCSSTNQEIEEIKTAYEAST